MTVILASNNDHKLHEIAAILAERKDFSLISMREAGYTNDIIENGTTFKENALIKADALHTFSGKAVIADDSGLCVDFLGDAPGIYSARYKDLPDSKSKNKSILEQLSNVPTEKRGARFICVIAYIDNKGSSHFFEGVCVGKIALTEAGSGGFGYDPIFIPEGFDCTMAELGEEEKNKISHRGRALAKFSGYLKSCS